MWGSIIHNAAMTSIICGIKVSALSYMLENLTKPVILTGSQLPIGQIRTDGKENLITAVEIAAAKNEDGTAVVPEVCIFFENHLFFCRSCFFLFVFF